MKQLILKKQIICALIFLIIVGGIITIFSKGFNFEMKYQDSKMMEIYLGKQFLLPDIQRITKDTLETTDFTVNKVEVYGESFSVTAREITEEQKSNFIQKINEMYGTELKAEEIEIQDVPHQHLKDIMKPFVIPLSVSTVLILVYIGIRFIKLGFFASIIKVAIYLIIAEAVLFNLMAIVRFPIGRLTLPLTLIIYLITIFCTTINLENVLKEKLLEEKESN